MSERLERIKAIDLMMTEEVSPHIIVWLNGIIQQFTYTEGKHIVVIISNVSMTFTVQELKWDPSVLHNTPTKIDERIANNPTVNNVKATVLLEC